MRAVLQRVTEASITIDGQKVGEIGKGIMVLFGMLGTDTDKTIDYMLDKVINLRIFEDENEKMNRSLEDVGGQVLVISQFTLYGNCRKGRRPDFLAAARPEVAIPLYEKFVSLCREKGIHTETGEFGAEMLVESVNDGPLTLVVDTDQLNA